MYKLILLEPERREGKPIFYYGVEYAYAHLRYSCLKATSTHNYWKCGVQKKKTKYLAEALYKAIPKETKKIALIGVGNIGKELAKSLVKRGHKVNVYDAK